VTDGPRPPRTGGFGPGLGRVGEALDALLAGPWPDALAARPGWEAALRGPLPETGAGADAVLDELLGVVVPNGSRISHPGFAGWITVGPTTLPVLAAAAAAVASPQRYTLTAFNLLEEQSLEWLADLCGLPAHMRGVYSSGGSTANLVALGAARQWALERRGVDPAADGMPPLPLAVYASAEAHHTVHRALGVLGIGRAALRVVPVDDRQRMDPAALQRMLREDAAAGVVPVAVCAAAGTTNTGAVDPLREVGELAAAHGAWFHVDGAYGLPGILDGRAAPAYDGLHLADSAIVDPHKWLGVPVGVGATFVRDREILFRAFTQEPADYLEGSFEAGDARVSLDSLGIPYGDLGVELSAPARGVQVWAALRELGREGVRARVVADVDLARRLADRARAHPRLQLLAEPQLSICCIRYAVPDVAHLDALNAAVHRRLLRDTDLMPSSTVVGGRFAIRPCFINARSAPDLADRLAEAVVAIGDDLSGRR
jgi:aromatic-L-amino-acid decarboxylase